MARTKKTTTLKRWKPHSIENGRKLAPPKEGTNEWSIPNGQSNADKFMLTCDNSTSVPLSNGLTHEFHRPVQKKRKRRDLQREIAGTPNLMDFLTRKLNAQPPVRREIKKNDSVEAVSKGRRKKKLLFEEIKKPEVKEKPKAKVKDVTIKSTAGVSSQIYSQSSNNGKSFNKQCNLALYCGPTEKYKRKTKDYEQALQDHQKEFELLEEEIVKSNPPKYIIESEAIFERFSNITDSLFELYSSRYNKMNEESLMSYIKSEFNRISIIYFSWIPGIQVMITKGHEDLKKNIKKTTLLTEKYQENYISDLIDPSKSSLRAYLYNFLNNFFLDQYINNTEEL